MRRLVAPLVGIAWLVACGAPADVPAGDRPQRIISLVPATTEMLFAIGAGPDVVGVGSFDRHPPEIESIPRVGALVDPDVERIFALRPDLVVVYGSQDDLISRLSRAGIPRYDYEHAGLADITDTIRSLGARVGRAGEAGRLASDIEREIEDIRSAVEDRPRPRTALIFGRDAGSLRGLFASGGVGFLHDMLVAAGGDDAFADVRRQSVQISVETLLARAPEVIMEVHPDEGWTPEVIARDLALWQTVPGLPAVRDGRVHILADYRLLVPGPRVADAIRLMAATLHPDAFRTPAAEPAATTAR